MLIVIMLIVIMLIVIMLIVIMLSVIMLSFVMLNVVAPQRLVVLLSREPKQVQPLLLSRPF